MDPVQQAMRMPAVAMRVLSFFAGAIVIVPHELRRSAVVKRVYEDALYGPAPPLVSSSDDTDELIARRQQFFSSSSSENGGSA